MHASIAERFAYGRPYDPVAGDTAVPVVPRSGTALIGRILIASIFLMSAFAKVSDPAATAGYMTASGVPNAETLVYVAAAAEIAGSLAIVFGFLTRIAALGLIAMLVLINYFMHPFWSVPAEQQQMQMAHFFKNVSIMGGLAMLVAMGPGRYSIDARMRRPKAA